MSGQDDQQRDLPPTAKRLRKARDDGQALHSKELTAAVSLVFTCSAAALMLPWAASEVATLYRGAMRLAAHAQVPSAVALALDALRLVAVVAIATGGVAAVAGTAAARLQTGAIFSMVPLKPRLERLNPIANGRNLFSAKSLVAIGMMMVKAVIVGIGLWLIAQGVLRDAVHAAHAGSGGVMAVAQAAMLKFGAWSLFAFLLLGGMDVLVQRHYFTKQLRMSHQEVRREYKEDEGDPIFKQARKQATQAPSPVEQLRYMRVATVVIEGHDGRGVPIYCRRAAPDRAEAIVILRAAGRLAAQARRLAEEHGVPVAVDDALLQQLWPVAVEGTLVPASLQAAVIEVVDRLQPE